MSRTRWILTIIGIAIVALVLWRILAGRDNAQADVGKNKPVPVTMAPPQSKMYRSTSRTTAR